MLAVSRGWYTARKTSHPEISCIVLVGGKSVRLGRDKALEPLGVSNMIERVLSRLSSFKSDIILVTNSGQSYNQFAQYPKLRFAVDIFPGYGPLGGIFTGLTASATVYNLVVGCDMPFLNVPLLDYMINLAAGYDVVVPRLNSEMTEQLHAVYSKNCLVTMGELIKRNQLKVFKLYPELKVRYVGAEEFNRFDPRHLSFFNVDTEADLKKAREIIKTGIEDDHRHS
ncbi:MAG: molybdenum cofactor guanylyltransferase [Dehalococcoidales bacterium]|nr:molybdenum cofactor guanylyltransferase [Dehalococcoidales bacterium]